MAFQTTKRVEFRDTDAAGITHFTSFFGYMEEAEHELLRSLGLSVVTCDEEGVISWPRVAVRCDFQGAAKFEDILDIAVNVERMSARSVTYSFRFSRQGQLIAQGEMTSVCCRIEQGQPPRSMPIPGWMAERIASLRDTSTGSSS